MLARYVKAQAMVLGFGGLVGPIFLIVFFATGQQPDLKWMFFTGLLVTFGDVLAALMVAGFSTNPVAGNQVPEQRGVPAVAQVTGIADTVTRINDVPVVKLDLHIEGAGLVPFDTQDRVIASVTRLPLIYGRKLAVLVDPATNRYRIDWQRSAELTAVHDAPEPRAVGERLQELEALHRDGVVTDEEYTRKRQQIIAEL